ncbi:LpxL/LpxP family acyltransferase [Methylophaga sp.]|uniref:LpxL/LpxP family acyltransferase n=1 Tax=Methylophaga sp. TaxID=2024840 RepID=UPI003F6A3568
MALEHYPSGDDLQDAQHLNDWLAEQIRQYSEQYLWLHHGFKTQPIGRGFCINRPEHLPNQYDVFCHITDIKITHFQLMLITSKSS